MRRLKDQAKYDSVVPAQGFEPWTFGLKDRCSNQAELRRLASNRIQFGYQGSAQATLAMSGPGPAHAFGRGQTGHS